MRFRYYLLALLGVAALSPQFVVAQQDPGTIPLVRAIPPAVSEQAQARMQAAQAVAPALNAQAALDFTEHNVGGAILIPLYAEVADLDGDGRNDIISTGANQSILTWYRNDEDYTFTPLTLGQVPTGQVTDIQVIDLDQDRDQDLVISDFGTTLYWFENDGTQTFTRHAIDGGSGQRLGVEVADFDGDGDLDIVNQAAGIGFALYRNDGNQAFTRQIISTRLIGYFEIADLDNDQDVDLIAPQFFGLPSLFWYENDGSGNFTERTIDATGSGLMDTYVGDLDGDQDLDIAAVTGNQVRVYLNDGSRNFTSTVIRNGTPSNIIQQIEGGDIDLDGDIDLFSSLEGNGASWFENDGNGGFTEHNLLTGNTAIYAALGDLDGNRSLDLVTGINAANRVLVAFENPLSGIIPVGSFSILESDGSSTVMEGGMTDQIAVSMGGITNTASLSVTSSDPSQLTVSPSMLNFNRANVNQSQTVTLTAVDDALLDGTQTATVTFSVNVGASDSQFSQLPDQTVTVSITDNEVAGLSVTESGGTTAVSEGGPGDSFEVALSVEPISDVTVQLMSSDPAQATVSPMMLTFSPGSGTQPQTVTVTAVDDASVDGEQTVTITASVDAATSDAAFASASAQSVSVSVGDNDTAGYSISQSGGTTSVTEAGTGSEDTFTISLDVAPEAGMSVMLNLMSSDTGEATVSPSSLTFSAGGTTSETVTITGVNDLLPDGDQTITVTVSVDGSSTDSRFTSLPDQVVSVQVIGVNNTPTATDDAATVAEDGSTVIAVLANDVEPDGDPLSIASHTNTGHGSLTQSGTSFTYTPAANFHGTDSFTYTIDDGAGSTSEATVTITVTPVPDAPVAKSDFFDVTAGVPTKLDVLANDSDADGDPLALRILPSALVTINTVTVDDNGTPGELTDDTILFTPREEFVGFDRFTYEVRDASGLTAQAQAYVFVSKPVGSRAAPADVASTVEAAVSAARQAQHLQEQAPRERLIEGIVVRAHDDVLTVQQGAAGTAVQLPTAWTTELAAQTDLRVSDFFAVGQQVTVTGLAVEGSDAVEAYTVAQGAITALPTAQAVTLAELEASRTHTLITISDLQWSDTHAGVGSTLEGGRRYAVSDAEGHTAQLYVPETSALVGATISDSRVTFTGIAVANDEVEDTYQLVALLEGDVIFGDAVAEVAEVPAVFELEANYPNPFNPQTQIRFGLPEASEVVLTVYDVRGREVATLVRGSLEAGRHQVTFSGQGLASGLYFYRITAGSFEATKSMLLLK